MSLLLPLVHAAEFGPSLEGELLPLADAQSEGDTGEVGCSDQYLDGGVQLPDLPLFYARITPDAAWGTPEMVEAIVSAARHMRWLMPEASALVVGDLSYRRGGAMHGHVSHRGGVDADIGLYTSGARQVNGQFANPGSDFDVVANWALVSAFLETGNVDFILLDRSHIARLRAYTLKAGLLTVAEAEAIFPSEVDWQQTGIVRHAASHADHIHVRVMCGDGSRAR